MHSTAHTPRPETARIVAHEDRLAEAASEILPLPEGRVILQPAYPHVFDANLIRHPHLDPARLDDQLARLTAPLRRAGAQHVQITCDAGPVRDAVRTGLRARGFRRERLLAMVLRGRLARRPARTVEVCAVPREAPLGDYAETMERMSLDEPWYSPQVSREITGSLVSKAEAGALALYVARLGGRPVGAAGLALDEESGVGAVTTVGTIAEARQRKVAQSMVATLCQRAREAGCDLIYLVARADDTPKDMYRKFGFEVSFGFDVWLRPPYAD